MSYLKALGLGIVAGMRSMTPPALIAHELRRTGSRELDESPLRFLTTAQAAEVTRILAAGEIMADKTPWIPDRISPPGLVGRGVSGALAGAALCSGDGNEEPVVGAVVGAAAALASAFAAYHLRKRLGEAGIPDPVLAAAEDVLAVGGGLLILRAETSGAAPHPAAHEPFEPHPALDLPRQSAVSEGATGDPIFPAHEVGGPHKTA